MRKQFFFSVLSLLLMGQTTFAGSIQDHTQGSKNPESKEVTVLNTRLAKGWNTWNTRSVLSQVLLPECFSINLQLQDKTTHELLTEALIGRSGKNKEMVKPGPHSYDGSYTELTVTWNNLEMKVQSAWEGNRFALMITPVIPNDTVELLIKPAVLWDRAGKVKIEGNKILFTNDSSNISLTVHGGKLNGSDTIVRCTLNTPIWLSTGDDNDLSGIAGFIGRARSKVMEEQMKYQSDSLLYTAMQSVLAWDVIYEPVHRRVIAPVSRIWNCNWNGWVLFDWDTYFASYMLSLSNKDLSYSNAIAITKEITPNGFIPNFGSGSYKSEDRSQPPVGSMIIREIYRKYHEKWLLKEVFDELITWNRWWMDNRDVDGYLCWGSNLKNPDKSSGKKDNKQEAMWESGLDNSPMYDEAVFDSTKHVLMMADVGLMSLYISDCRNLAEIAKELGKSEIEKELVLRGDQYAQKLETLWNEKFGMYLNRNLSTGAPSYRVSPTLFYPLLAKVPDQKQAQRMISEHFNNPKEFRGEWIIPSIARNDSAFKDNNYWRGRIWAPMNFLIYLGMRNYDLPLARKDLTEKSGNLLLKSWTEENHVYENYNSVNGQGGDVTSSDKFYHWGALLGFISLIENGYVLPLEKPLKEAVYER